MYSLKSLLGKYSGISIFFSPLVSTCVWVGDGRRALCLWLEQNSTAYSQPFLFQLFAQLLWVTSLSMMSTLLWWNLPLQHLDLLKHFANLCLESFLCVFFPTLSPFLWKCSLQGPTYLQHRSSLLHAGSVKFLVAETGAWFKLQWSQWKKKKAVIVFNRFQSNFQYIGMGRTGL